MKYIFFLFLIVISFSFVSSLAVNLTVDGTTGDCIFDHGSTWNQSNASDNFRSLFHNTCGWTIQNWSLGSVVINDVVVYVEHVGETGIATGSVSLLVGNSTTQNVYGTRVLSDFEGNQNKLEDSQGLPITGEGVDFYNSTDPSTIARLNDLVIRIINADTNDAAGVDHIVVGVTYSADGIAPSVFDVRPVANSTYSSLQVIEISANVTDSGSVDKVLANVTFPNSTTQLLVLNNIVGDKYNASFSIPDSSLQGRFNVTFIANDSFGNVNNSVTTYFVSQNPCVYSGSGNWVIPCSNNCVISSNVNLGGSNISIIGTGSFTTTANISNFRNLYISGTSSVNRCNIYCLGGGCFT